MPDTRPSGPACASQTPWTWIRDPGFATKFTGFCRCPAKSPEGVVMKIQRQSPSETMLRTNPRISIQSPSTAPVMASFSVTGFAGG